MQVEERRTPTHIVATATNPRQINRSDPKIGRFIPAIAFINAINFRLRPLGLDEFFFSLFDHSTPRRGQNPNKLFRAP
jgi:hypothetical protein